MTYDAPRSTFAHVSPSAASLSVPALPPLLVFGEALTDFVHRGNGQWQSAAGGACWNVARVAATLGVPTGWGGALSNDPFGQEIVALSQAAGLDARYWQVVDKPALIAMVHRTDPPDYAFLGNDSADLAFDPALLPQGWQDTCRIAHFGCISLVREPLAGTLTAIAKDLHRRGAQISFDANYRNLMGPGYPAFFEEMAATADLVKVSDEDLTRIYPGRDLAASLTAVRALVAGRLLLYTRGGDGMTLFAGDRQYEQRAIPVDVKDTVGAGDACIGGFLASKVLYPDAPLTQHLRFAAATAASVCTHTGAHAPGRPEVDALLAAETATTALRDQVSQ